MMALFHSFLKDARGVTALTFGLALPAIALAVGGGIDLSQAASRRQRIASAVELGCQHASQEISYQKRQANANPNKDYTATVNQIVNAKVNAVDKTGISNTGVTSSIAKDVITVVASASSTNAFGKVLGFDTVSLRVERNCTVAAAAAPGQVLFTESFENNHTVASNDWSVLKNWNGWTTVNGGIEINGIPELAANTIRFGNFFAELDSHCYVANCRTNSIMWREFTLASGTYELSYWYISRVRNPAYAGQTLCAYRSDAQSVWDKLAAATWESQTNRIEVFFQKKSGNYSTPSKDVNKATDQVDVCVHADKWTERKISLNVTSSGSYRIYFQAAGREDTYGGLIDYIRFCSGKCP
jgi:Flp pilus assembly protein TadG